MALNAQLVEQLLPVQTHGAWISLAEWRRAMVVHLNAEFGTDPPSLLQAKDDAGTGSKTLVDPVTAYQASESPTSTGIYYYEINQQDLDADNGFLFFKVVTKETYLIILGDPRVAGNPAIQVGVL